jgi:anhydro-N-acetylmuramic acid kinase
MSKHFKAIGLMSGTSLDGLDICLSDYSFSDEKWSFSIVAGSTVGYDSDFKRKLQNSYSLPGRELMLLDAEYGIWCGERVKEFLEINKINPASISVIGSHGHTVFHDPAKGFSTQIGNGAQIAAVAGIKCVSNFRSADIARGGQGAPLVPIGDELLFHQFDKCLNLGGFANISYIHKGERVAYDICPVNMILNSLAERLGEQYDRNGLLAQSGLVNDLLLRDLNSLPFYSVKGPKSLAKEWFVSDFLPVIDNYPLDNKDLLRTTCEHIAIQIASKVGSNSDEKILCTGGGAKNEFLMDLIRSKTSCLIISPENSIIDFKEALIFGFLAVLFLTGTPSCLASATGAAANSIGGCLYY